MYYRRREDMYIKQRKRGPVGKNWVKEAEEQLNSFIEKIKLEELMNNKLFDDEGSSGDTEASYLSQLIFRNIFQLFGFISKCSFKRHITIGKVYYYFDIMNNPKFESKMNNKQKRMGKKIYEKDQEKYKEWEAIYHTLGNFAPYPDIKIDRKKIQNFHESICYERWDLVLSEMQNQWEITTSGMSFAEYLIATGQIIYDENVFAKIPDGDITYEWYMEQSHYIFNNEIRIINFNRGCENVVLNDENVEYAVDAVLKLISIRTKILLMLLRKQKEGLKLDLTALKKEKVISV